MKLELFKFQQDALADLRSKTAEALGSYNRTHSNAVVSFTAPTGAGKTIIMTNFIEDVFFGDDYYAEQPDAVIVWLSDSPQLNEQSKNKIDLKSDKIQLGQCVVVSDDSFDQEVFDDGHIYFLNTQKLGKTSNLTKNTDMRQYTIWETLANTAESKFDRFYVIIDEAHRGMLDRSAAKATTIMQKFIKGSPEDGIEPMPVVIGMTATPDRFEALVKGTSSTIYKSIVNIDDVRASGLLKDRIVISYPENASADNDMSVLKAAVNEWIDKWKRWYTYCFEQHYAYVNPVLVVQVKNAKNDKISETNMDECVRVIEDQKGSKFDVGEVVHTFGDVKTTLNLNGLDIPYIEPSDIADDKNVKVVFFKESLSTGWDCPRAETMMSFRVAKDSTYIAQLLGRMIRTPMQKHVQFDDTLNDVRLFLPYFNSETVKQVVDELQSEAGDLPADISAEAIGKEKSQTLTTKPKRSIFVQKGNKNADEQNNAIDFGKSKLDDDISSNSNNNNSSPNSESSLSDDALSDNRPIEIISNVVVVHDKRTTVNNYVVIDPSVPTKLDEIIKYINDFGLLTYRVRNTRVDNYIKSMFALAHFLTQTKLCSNAIEDILSDIDHMILEYSENLKQIGKYENLVKQILEFNIKSDVYDVFGNKIEEPQDLFSMASTDKDIDRQFRDAESKLFNEGVGVHYGQNYYSEDSPNSYKIDFILYVVDERCMELLQDYAHNKFNNLNDMYRHRTTKLTDKYQDKYDSIVSNSDFVTRHNFRLPQAINVGLDNDGDKYADHLYVNEDGFAQFKLNEWERGVIKEEQSRSDFICWLRNYARSSWGLCIPYKIDNEHKMTYPDFLIVRNDGDGGYIVDVLEPHDSSRKDNLPKAKGFAKYAEKNPGLGRIQLIRKMKDKYGKLVFMRLDMAKTAVRDKVLNAYNNDELDHIFETDGLSY